MYPFLTGFWISAGASTGIMFVLLYRHQTHPDATQLPAWIFTAVSCLVYLAPLIGLTWAWNSFHQFRHRETTRASLRKRFTGALLGAIVILVVAYFLLPAVKF